MPRTENQEKDNTSENDPAPRQALFLPSVPVQPIILAMQEGPGMFDFYRNFRSFLKVHRYASQEQLIADRGEKVIAPVEAKVKEVRRRMIEAELAEPE
jgi:hypothetical protein